MPAIELEILTQDENEKRLCHDYWTLSSPTRFSYSVTKLAELHKTTKTKVNEIVKRGCRAYLADDSCRNTNCTSLRRIETRLDFDRNRQHRYFRREWICARIERIRLEEELARRTAVLQNQLSAQIDKANLVGRLSLRDTLFLVGVLRVGGSEELDHVRPLQSFSRPLSPSESYDEEILLRLLNAGLLCIHPRTPAGSAVVSGTQFKHPLGEVFWTLPLPPGGPTPARFLEVLEQSLHEPWPEDWSNEVQELYNENALQECLRYLQLLLEEHYLKLIYGEKTTFVLRSALREFSIGQVFNFIWYSVKQAAADMQKRLPRPQVLNRIPGTIQRCAERALAEGWIVKPYRRHHRAPESQIAQLLFTSVLKLGDGGLAAQPPWEAGARSML